MPGQERAAAFQAEGEARRDGQKGKARHWRGRALYTEQPSFQKMQS
jgi:hypothetical protein